MGADPLKAALENAFDLTVLELVPVRGGDIAKSFRLQTPEGPFFAKILDSPEGLQMLQAEAEGLKAISGTNTLKVPEVLGVVPLGSGGCLLMEYISPGTESRATSEALGRGLAQMHQATAPAFGWKQSNYIGSLPQENPAETDWAVFYARHRLLPQYRMAREQALMAREEIPDVDHMIARISALAENARPSLLHGDLWGGNFLISDSGIPYLIDPAVYYGHAEVDLAMSLLFGGFSPHFYGAYHEMIPKKPGFDRRVKLYQLYYLLVHLNLFGRSYYGSVSAISSALFYK